MKISVDGQELFSLSDTHKKVIMNDIHEDIFDADMKRRLQYILTHKYENCMNRLRDQWMPKLKDRTASVPTNDDALAELIFSQPDYQSRKQRDELEKNLV